MRADYFCQNWTGLEMKMKVIMALHCWGCLQCTVFIFHHTEYRTQTGEFIDLLAVVHFTFMLHFYRHWKSLWTRRSMPLIMLISQQSYWVEQMTDMYSRRWISCTGSGQHWKLRYVSYSTGIRRTCLGCTHWNIICIFVIRKSEYLVSIDCLMIWFSNLVQ